MEIPVVDLSQPSLAVGEELVRAATTYGFVFVKNDGSDVPTVLREQVFDLSRQFFSSPRSDKEKCSIGPDNKGWSAVHSEKLDPATQKRGDFKEAFNFGEFDLSGNPQQALPVPFAQHVSIIHDFFTSCHALKLKLLNLFALGLHIDPSEGGEHWFSSRHDPLAGSSSRTLRLLHYPAHVSSPDVDTSDIRAGAHSDYGSLTLLYRLPGQPGLEILSRDNTWTPVPIYPPGTEDDGPPPILVNIGDLLEYWTRGLLKSTVHRVVMPTGQDEGAAGERYSIAYFGHPVNATKLESIPSEMVKDRKPFVGKGAKSGKGESLTAGEYLMMRLNETYGWDAGTEGREKAELVAVA